MENKSFNFDLQLFAEFTLTSDISIRGAGTARAKATKFTWTSAGGSSVSATSLAALLQNADVAGALNSSAVINVSSSLIITDATAALDFNGATVNITSNAAETGHGFVIGSESKVTISHVIINNTNSVASDSRTSIELESNAKLTLSGVTMNTSGAGASALGGRDFSGELIVENSTLNSTGTAGSVFYFDQAKTNGGTGTIDLDSKTTITSSATGKDRIFYIGSAITVTSAAAIENKSASQSLAELYGTDAQFVIDGGSYNNVSGGTDFVKEGSEGGFTVAGGTFTLKEKTEFETERATYTVKTVGSASSGAVVTVSKIDGSVNNMDITEGSFNVAVKNQTLTLNGVEFSSGGKTILAAQDWYDYDTYSDGFAKGSKADLTGWYFTELPQVVDSSTSGIVPDGVNIKSVTGAESDATVTLAKEVKSGDIKLVVQGDAKVSKIVNGTDTLVAGSFEIAEDGTLLFGADLSSEESSDDTSGETSDDTSGETSDESGETSDESGETSDESGETSDESGETSDESGETSDESGETSDESGETSDESGETSDESGETSDESGETSDESGETSDESGETSDESGETSDESGETSDESGETSDESGETSDESGETSDESGETSDESGDTTDDTDEAESFIKDLADGEVHDMTDQSSVTLGKGDLASVPSDATGTKTINMGDDAAYVSIAKGAKAKVNINLGAGDNFVSNGGTNTAIDFSNALKTKVALGDGSHADFNSYDWKTGAGIATSADASGLTSFYEALASKLINLLSAFTLSSPASSTTSSDVLDDLAFGTDTNDADEKSAYVNLYYGESYNKNVVMGMTGSGDSYINTNENDTLRDEPIVLVGNYTNNVSGTASLISGSGNDGVFAGDGDTVDAGTGTNNIYLGTTGTSAKGTTIMMTSGDNFVTGMGNNDGIITEAGVDAVTAEDGNMVFRNDDGGITTIVNGADGVRAYNVRAAGVDYSAVAGTSKVAYNGVSNYYNASNQNASITASTSSAEIWLNKDVARSYGYTSEFIGDIKYVNASGVSGRTTLAGAADIDNVITAGSGASSMWGGGSSDDTLIAGKGSNTFFYMKGDGNDSIRGADDYDTVRIEGGMTLADITKIDVSNAAVALEFSDGGSLTLNSNNGTKFKIDGATYTYDKSAGDWQKS